MHVRARRMPRATRSRAHIDHCPPTESRLGRGVGGLLSIRKRVLLPRTARPCFSFAEHERRMAVLDGRIFCVGIRFCGAIQ